MEWYIGVTLIGLCMLFYVLYNRGYLPVKSMSAIYFVGSMGVGNNRCCASFRSANGQIKRVLRFKEGRPYAFDFKGKISKGSVCACILDSNQIVELELDDSCPGGIINAEKGKRYYLVIRFQNAEGEYTLTWK